MYELQVVGPYLKTAEERLLHRPRLFLSIRYGWHSLRCRYSHMQRLNECMMLRSRTAGLPLGRCLDSTSIGAQPLPSKSFLILLSSYLSTLYSHHSDSIGK
jgi:hypothetical protein